MYNITRDAAKEWAIPKGVADQPRRSNLTNLMSFASIDVLPRSQFENRRHCVALAKILL